MIRRAELTDAQDIADIYNEYVLHNTATFETEAVSVREMQERIEAISSGFPFFVHETACGITGYAYAHLWKERAAYRYTWETTVYVAPKMLRTGIGTLLMSQLIQACKDAGCHALIACITAENTASLALHRKLGFQPVSQFREVGFKFGKALDVADLELLL